MNRIIISYKLKPGVSREDFEAWIRTTDYPGMRGLKRVQSFVTNRVVKNLLTGGPGSVDYVEVFEIPDIEGFVGEDLPGGVVQAIMGEFMNLVENPEFLVVEEVS
ncbi:MAG: hypothetical protein QM627_03225 [Luteolibacter sp.]